MSVGGFFSFGLQGAEAGGAGGGGGAGATATAFLARTSGLNATHINAYTALLNGMDGAGLTPKFDWLHVYATQDSATALLNLVSNNYNGVAHGAPVFTADRGYIGVSGSSTVYIDTLFNPNTAPSPKFTLNSAHLSAWNLTVVALDFASIGAIDGTNFSHLVLRALSDGKTYCRINTDVNSGIPVVNTTASGHYIGNRSASNAEQGYYQGAPVASGAVASTAMPNFNIYTLADNSSNTARGCAMQLAMASAGASLSAADATNFTNLVRAYGTAVGIP